MAWFLNCLGDCLLVLRDINTTRETLGFFESLGESDTKPLVTNSKYIAIGEFVDAEKAAEVLDRSDYKDNILISTEKNSDAVGRSLISLNQHLKHEKIGRYATAAAEYHKLESIGPTVSNAKLIEDLTKETGRLYRIQQDKITVLKKTVERLQASKET